MSEENKKDWRKFKEESKLEEELEDNFEEQELDALDHPSYTALEEKLTLAEQKAHENWEKSLRAVAELENVRRRTEREVSEAVRYGAAPLVRNLLDAIDGLEKALQLAREEGQQGMVEGLELTLKLILDAFKKQGVEQIDPEGEPFNPQDHEAMSIQEVAGVAPNTVLTVFQKGYKLHDRIIRPARVVVAKAKSE